MRSEIKYHRRNFLRSRHSYIADLNGKHRQKGLEVQVVWIGVGGPDEFFDRARDLSTRPRGPGAPLQYLAWEITAHPADSHGARRAFRDQAEMFHVGREVVKQMHGVVALIGCHGLQDLHVLLLNDGPTGLGLKSYLPNRSNPRRVMVAAIDRIEAEINEERAFSGREVLTTMAEIRDEERRSVGYAPLLEIILERVPENREPEIADVLEAFRTYGWKLKVHSKKNRLDDPKTKATVYYERGAKTYEIDRLRESLLKAWWARSHEREKKRQSSPPPCEAITAAIYEWVATNVIPLSLEPWLALRAGLLEATDDLHQKAREHPSPESDEMFAAFSTLRAAQREIRRPDRHLDHEHS